LEKEAHLLRQEQLQTQKASALAAGSTAKAKRIKHLIAGEEMKEVTRELRMLNHKQENRGISCIEVPVDPMADPKASTTKEWRVVDAPEEVTKLLQDRNKKHFGQAHGTFPTVTPFKTYVDWAANTVEAEMILEGDFETSEFEEISNLVVKHMEKNTPLDSVSTALTVEQWVGKIKTWRESTSTSPSGMHLGHHK
jgi:hypothetical protein